MLPLDMAYVLVVGIGGAKISTLGRLSSAQVNTVYNLLIDPECCGDASENVRARLDEQATLNAIREARANLTQRADTAAVVPPYFVSRETVRHAMRR